MTEHTIPSRKLTHDGVRALIDAAVAKADEMGVPMGIAIANDGARIVGYLLMDGARILAQDSASAKAMTTTPTTTFKLKPGALTVADGSGLSRENAVTPEAMTTVLSGATTRCYWELLCGAMAKSGESGTLKKRMTDIAGRIVAKTGYINGVSCLSGYLLDKPGGKPIYSFSILTRDIRSGADAKKFQDSLCRQLLTHLDAK